MFGWNLPNGSGEEDNNVNRLHRRHWQQEWQQRWTTDKFRSEKPTSAFGFFLGDVLTLRYQGTWLVVDFDTINADLCMVNKKQ